MNTRFARAASRLLDALCAVLLVPWLLATASAAAAAAGVAGAVAPSPFSPVVALLVLPLLALTVGLARFYWAGADGRCRASVPATVLVASLCLVGSLAHDPLGPRPSSGARAASGAVHAATK